MNLKTESDYVYRAGISTGQGIKWGEYIEFRSSSPPGFIPSSDTHRNESKPVLSFRALADQGVSTDAGQNVSILIANIVNNNQSQIDSIHIIGDQVYADGNTHVWDHYMEMIEPFASRIPTMVAVDNHEYDYHVGDGSKMDVLLFRLGTHLNNLYCTRSSEHNLTRDCINRTIPPWVVVEPHRPHTGRD